MATFWYLYQGYVYKQGNMGNKKTPQVHSPQKYWDFSDLRTSTVQLYSRLKGFIKKLRTSESVKHSESQTMASMTNDCSVKRRVLAVKYFLNSRPSLADVRSTWVCQLLQQYTQPYCSHKKRILNKDSKRG